MKQSAPQIGSKYCTMLPRKHVEDYKVPSIGMIINYNDTSRMCVLLVEEYWKYNGYTLPSLYDDEDPVKPMSWGWEQIVSLNKVVTFCTGIFNIKTINRVSLNSMIKLSITDYSELSK